MSSIRPEPGLKDGAALQILSAQGQICKHKASTGFCVRPWH